MRMLQILSLGLLVITMQPAWASLSGVDYAAIATARSNLKMGYAQPNESASDAAKRMSKAANDLKNYPYSDVASDLIQRLQLEVNAARANSFVLTACIDALKSMANSSDVKVLQQIEKSFDASPNSSATWAKHVSAGLEELIAAASSNTRILPPLPQLKSKVVAATQVHAPQNQNNVGAGNNNAAQGKNNGQPAPTFKEELIELLGKNSESAAIMLKGAKRFLGDKERNDRLDGKNNYVLYRDAEADRVMDILIRAKGPFPILVGLAGVGKTTVVERINQKIIDGDFPQTSVYKEYFSNAEIIETSASKISTLAKSNDNNSQAEAVRMFLEATIALQKEMGRPLIIYIDEIHMLQKPQIEAMLTYLDSSSETVRIIGATNSEKLQFITKTNEAFDRRKEEVGVEEFTEEQTRNLLRNAMNSILEKKYNVTISDEAVEAALRQAPTARPNNRRPEGPFKLLQDVAIALHRKNVGALVPVKDTDVYDMVKKITGLPVNPHNIQDFDDFILEVKNKVKAKVIGRDQIIDRIFDNHVSDILISDSRRPKVIVDVGTTGTGKSHLGENIALNLFRSKSHFFEIDGTAFQNGGFDDNSLFGAPNGVLSSDTSSGSLMEWLDDPSRGKFGGVIVINEGEKMNEKVWKRLMEFFDKGQIAGGDGKFRFANRHLVIITSNRGAKQIFPDSIEKWSEQEIDKRLENTTSDQIKKYFTSATDGKDEFKLPPEVVGRVDEFMASRPSTRQTAIGVAQLVAKDRLEQYKEKYGISLTVSDKLIEYLALARWNINEGNRPIKRTVEEFLGKSFSEARRVWKLSKGSTAHLELYLPHVGAMAQIQITADGREPIFSEAPQAKQDNPFLDKELIATLQNLPTVMGKQVIGQDEAINSLVQSIWAQRMNKISRPISMFVVGPTGLGKTELGRALANGLYGSSDRVGILSLGDVANDIDLNKKMGPPPGIVGATQQWEFEKLLASNPEGGVIIFDEASNMGGGSKEMKAALFKRLYEIVEEGKWQSPANSSIVYDLRKYTFIFTGNDAEKLFQGLTDDDLRLATWTRNKSREQVRRLLIEAGVPEAFIGRMCDLILMKPPTKEEQKQISEKIIKIETGKFQKNYPTVKIKYDQNFKSQMAESFFTHDKGGRSVRDIVELRLAALISMLMVQSGVEPTADQGDVEVTLTLTDNLKKKPFVRDADFKRKVELGASIRQNGKDLGKKSIDLVEYANSRPLFDLEAAKSFAFHEVGHALMNEPSVTGNKLAFVTIYGGRMKEINYLGYARYEPIENKVVSPTPKSVLFEMAGLYAGSKAEELAGYEKSAGWHNDLEKIRDLAQRYFIDFGFSKKYLAVRLDSNKNPIISGELARELEKDKLELIEEAERIAEEILKENWYFVRSAVAELLHKGNMSGKRFDDIGQWVDQKKTNTGNLAKSPTGKYRSIYKTYQEYMERQRQKPKIEPVTATTIMIGRVRGLFEDLLTRPSRQACESLF